MKTFISKNSYNMKKLQILLSVILILGVVFYALMIISDDNTCTSVRKFTKTCALPAIQTTNTDKTWAEANITETGGYVETDTWTTVTDSSIKSDVIPAANVFTNGLDTSFDSIIETDTNYKITYKWKDTLEIYISKDRNWTERVVKNWVDLSRDEINSYYKK
jgi:hypothetical protein